MSNVIHLNFRAVDGKTEGETWERTFTACVCCKNKTFVVMQKGETEFPDLVCAACGADIGKIGFVPREE